MKKQQKFIFVTFHRRIEYRYILYTYATRFRVKITSARAAFICTDTQCIYTYIIYCANG